MLDPETSPPPLTVTSPTPQGIRTNPFDNPQGLPSSSGPTRGRGLNPESAYNFEMYPSIESQAMPKRVTQGGKKSQRNAMAGVYGDGEIPKLPSLSVGGNQRDKGRHHSAAGILARSHKPPSPSGGSGERSASPGYRQGSGGLNTNSMNLQKTPGMYVSGSGKTIDINNAYRRMSDAAFMRSGGSLSSLPTRKGSDPAKGEMEAPGGGVRLQKDYYADEGEEDAVESSDEGDYEGDTSGAESNSTEKRGRGRTPLRRTTDGGPGSEESASPAGHLRTPKSLLAAAEEDRKKQAGLYQVRSLLEPAVTVTGPDGEKIPSKRRGVHPTTSFDHGSGSGINTPLTSDTEADMTDIRRAQKLSLTMSPIHSDPQVHRVIRSIYRGDFNLMMREANQGLRRQRVYLVATDLSAEAEFALEWTIGTVLRDGDTLLAVYAVDEEAGTGGGGVGIGEGASVIRDTASIIGGLDNQPVPKESKKGSTGPSPLSRNSEEVERSGENRTMSKAERERFHAANEVSDRCVKLLRKTRLQVRVVVEVFHCKSPRHMITEVIDFLSPTLVILGSRGRSALKGVLLGSFSNYLVTKSSVPVMVARKRLRKHSKYKNLNLRGVRLSNMLTPGGAVSGGRLVGAKID
ncbi:hypothetical protein B0A49_02174 [Cryomyces minteri]|uniref:UspA domain-containing protein n=1 Tax=Cryomyces minteri TaxID=331657 RepID=A0A4U0XTY3_9PEZI|nr:hypothetical protein B0A49_02174 [Cryomyces minteri]